MKIEMTEVEQALLAAETIPFDPNRDYTEDEALNLLDQVREIEIFYSQSENKASEALYYRYKILGDKIFSMIPG